MKACISSESFSCTCIFPHLNRVCLNEINKEIGTLLWPLCQRYGLRPYWPSCMEACCCIPLDLTESAHITACVIWWPICIQWNEVHMGNASHTCFAGLAWEKLISICDTKGRTAPYTSLSLFCALSANIFFFKCYCLKANCLKTSERI